jgi:multidrug efflux pump subunit AcrA (membrane-fusion protein)
MSDVVHVSADSLTDPHTNTPSYLAHVAIDRGQLEAAGGLELHPGMPAEVMIVTGRRTALDYLLAPIEENFARAFRAE